MSRAPGIKQVIFFFFFIIISKNKSFQKLIANERVTITTKRDNFWKYNYCKLSVHVVDNQSGSLYVANAKPQVIHG